MKQLLRPTVVLSVVVLAAVAFLLANGRADTEWRGPVTVRVEVPGKQWKAARIRNLPAGARLAGEIECDGTVSLHVLDEKAYAAFPASEQQSLFRASVTERLSFTVAIPATGHYMIVVDNRGAEEPRNATITVKAARGEASAAETPPAASGGPETKAQLGAVDEQLSSLQAKLGTIFVFEPFPMHAKACGQPKAFVDGAGGVVLCAEYAQRVYEVLGEKDKAADALLFALFHEVGHVLLKQWKSPFFDNEEVADEFSTVLMVLSGQAARLRATAELFIATPATAEALAKATRDDRHPLSVQRARNIVRWANNPDLLHKWQSFLIPHFQTAVLEKIRTESPDWADRALLDDELASRDGKKPAP